MNIWNLSKFKKWFNAGLKNRLIIDFESEYISDGYSVLKINEELKEILNNKYLITHSIAIHDGKIIDRPYALKKYFDDFCRELETTKQELELTPCFIVQSNIILSIFYSENLVLQINKSFHEIINQNHKVKYYGVSDCKPLAVEVNGEVIAVILPARKTTGFQIKKATHK